MILFHILLTHQTHDVPNPAVTLPPPLCPSDLPGDGAAGSSPCGRPEEGGRGVAEEGPRRRALHPGPHRQVLRDHHSSPERWGRDHAGYRWITSVINTQMKEVTYPSTYSRLGHCKQEVKCVCVPAVTVCFPPLRWVFIPLNNKPNTPVWAHLPQRLPPPHPSSPLLSSSSSSPQVF